MIKEVAYSGFSVAEPDYSCPDGQLAVASGCIPEDGALRPLSAPSVVFNPESGAAPKFIHSVAGQKNFIYLFEEADVLSVRWKKDGGTASGIICSFDTFLKIDAIGNVLLIFADGGMHYALWRDGSYHYLGDHLAELPLSFGLQPSYKWSDKKTCPTNKLADKEYVNNLAHGLINKFIADNATNDGKFIFPFVVRYALRLFDGSLVMHSAPVPIWCATRPTPRIDAHSSSSGYDIVASAPVFSLDYAVELTASQLSAVVSRWSDIVKSVDIFISRPVYTYDQNVEYEDRFVIGAKDWDSADYSGYCSAVCKKDGVYGIYRHSDLITGTSPIGTPDLIDDNTYFTINTPGRWRKARLEMFSAAQFYLLRSIPVTELKTERTVIDIPKDYLQSLTSREVMTDDYLSHESLAPTLSYVYNERLNLAGIARKPFDGFRASCLTPRHDAERYVTFYVSVDDGSGQQLWLKSDESQAYMSFDYFYYPSTAAKRVVIEERDGTSSAVTRRSYALRPHDFLNGACCYGDDIEPETRSGATAPAVSTNPSIAVPSKIYTSEVNNPFLFPVTGINTVGAGEIRGLCSAARALSQGQFGQFPLYAFSTDGVWALEVGTNGSYTARQPITRDVCINPDGITQLDAAVLFPSDRGIMLISGSQTRCISEPLNSDYPFNVLSLPGFKKLHDMAHVSTDSCLPTVPFSQFLRACRMIYDYVHQHVIVYAPSLSYAYVFSLKSQQWGMMHSDIAASLNAYPEALAVAKDNKVVSFSEPSSADVSVLFATRPLKLGDADILKTVDTVIQRGSFDGAVSTALYGSRDLVNWHLVWSSTNHRLRGFRGSPYKYFRIASVAQLAPGESIQGATVQFTPRLTNQPR